MAGPLGRDTNRYASSGTLRIAYELQGTMHRRRPWLVLVHGMGFDRSGWDPVLPALRSLRWDGGRDNSQGLPGSDELVFALNGLNEEKETVSPPLTFTRRPRSSPGRAAQARAAPQPGDTGRPQPAAHDPARPMTTSTSERPENEVNWRSIVRRSGEITRISFEEVSTV